MVTALLMDLSLITNDTALAREAEAAGIERIMIDLETMGKRERQQGLDLHLSDHAPVDVERMRRQLGRCLLMVRINPVNPSSSGEIERVIAAGADIIMLPMFRGEREVEVFLSLVKGRCRTCLLVETSEAVENLGQILRLGGIDEVHIGLNDLSLSMGTQTIFDVITSGLAESLSRLVRASSARFGIGGIARLDRDDLPVPPHSVIGEQVRLGAAVGLMGRSFRQGLTANPSEVAAALSAVRRSIEHWQGAGPAELSYNSQIFASAVRTWAAQSLSRGGAVARDT